MQNHNLRYISAALLVLAASLTITPANAEAATRIMLVGDSITEGSEGDTAYRCDLWDTLAPTHSIDFVGAFTNAGDCETVGFDANHDSNGGATTAMRITQMDGSGSFDLEYEAVLLHIGTNDQNGVDLDWNQSYIDETIEPNFRTMVAKLRQSNPTVTIYMAQLIPCDFGPANGFLGCDVTQNGGLDNEGNPVEGMNDVWARIAADSTTPSSPIVLVDHREGFDVATDLKPDQVHPNDSGSAKMAAKWAEALMLELPEDGDEILLVEPSGRWHIRQPGAPDRTFWYGAPGDVPLFGDWDGDGLDTPGAWRQGPGGGFAYLTNSLPLDGEVGVAEFDFFFGNPGDQVFVGDWNGDSMDTLGIDRDGHIFLADSNGTGGQAVPTDYDFFFGVAGDRAFGGDGDGDGNDAVFLYRPSDGFVYYTNETPVGPGAVASTEANFFFGIASDSFVAGDWNGDEVDSAGIFRSSNTTVYLSNTNVSGGAPAPTDISYPWGEAGWTPVAGDWQ